MPFDSPSVLLERHCSGDPTAFVALVKGHQGELLRLARPPLAAEARLAQLGTGDFLFAEPGFFEVCLLPQVYNARRFEFDFSDMPHITRIESACLPLPEFQRAHPDNQSDNPENT